VKEGHRGCLDTAEYSNYLSVCGNFTLCNKETNHCTRLFSLYEGEQCGDVLNCQLPFECINGVCQRPFDSYCNEIKWNCTSNLNDDLLDDTSKLIPKSGCASMKLSKSCVNYKYPHPCQAIIEEWEECGHENKCNPRHIFDRNYGCMASKCSTQQSDLEYCLQSRTIKNSLYYYFELFSLFI